MTRLDGKVALVTGASRGVGKGVAHALAGAGATVYVTGRSVEGGEPTTSLPGTIERTAAEAGANVRARTEGILKWADYIDLANSESPAFVGRAVVELAADPNVLDRSGTVQIAAELAEEYGFAEQDGTQPRSLRPQFDEVT